MVRAVASIIGVPKESLPHEQRVGATPESVKKLGQRGLVVHVERGAGVAAGYSDQSYIDAGAKIVDSVWNSETLFKVRAPTLDEVTSLKDGAFVVSLMQPERNPGLIDALKKKKATALALERIPRVTRAQKMDVLSSQANLAGYRAVIEAASHLQGFMGPQVTAAGSTPPAKVLIIGAGVAGLAAVGAARALGAQVRAFDTRAAAREQVESLGAQFLEVTLKESGEGGGGYAKVMSPEFIAAEMALFQAQAKEVDVIITTALVPGTKAPTLVPRDVVEALKPGSVIVDMAAEQGGNCELTKPGEIVMHNGVTILGFVDLASRMATTSSRFFAMNLVHLTGELGTGDTLSIPLENDVVRPALLLHQGEVLPPLPARDPTPQTQPASPPKSDARPLQTNVNAPNRSAWGSTLAGLAVIGTLFGLGRFAPPDFLQHSTVFVLACFIGWQVVWSVTPALHTPLMSVTNAISGIIIIGGLLQVGDVVDLASVLGVLAVFFATINIAGGFLVTERMLKMFQRSDAAPTPPGAHR
jgi:H+-translocating NAD(P) transhydrogenase subunit alpha